MILALDPSLTSTGWAVFWTSGELYECGAVRISKRPTPERIREICEVAKTYADPYCVGFQKLLIEYPQFYQRPKSKGDPNKLSYLAALAGALTLTFQHDLCEYINPAQWKGQLPKTVAFSRVLKKLTSSELMRYNLSMGRKPEDLSPPGPSAKAGDALDAIGLGLWYLKR